MLVGSASSGHCRGPGGQTDGRAERFVDWRKRLGLTGREAAEALGVSVSKVRLLDRGRRYDSQASVEPTAGERALMARVETERSVHGLVGGLQAQVVEAARAAGLDGDAVAVALAGGALVRRVARLVDEATPSELARLHGAVHLVEDLVQARKRKARGD